MEELHQIQQGDLGKKLDKNDFYWIVENLLIESHQLLG